MHLIQRKLLEASRRRSFEGLTLREIGELIGLNHPQLIKHHLSQLIKKGLLNKRYQPQTSDYLAGVNLMNIPVLGSANCGEPTRLAEENLEGYLKISPNILPSEKSGDLFALKAVGDSMNKAQINNTLSVEDGDYIIIDSGFRSPQNGDYVVSIIDGAANVKRFFLDKQKQLIYLLSESSNDYPPIVIREGDDFMVNGKAIHVIKKPQGGKN